MSSVSTGHSRDRRQVRFLQLFETLNKRRFKVYGMAYPGRPFPGENFITTARGLLPEMMKMHPENRESLYGFIILHADKDADYILFCWWGGPSMVYQDLFRLEQDGKQTYINPAEPVINSWESELILFEKESWTDRMLSDSIPDEEGYIACRFNGAV